MMKPTQPTDPRLNQVLNPIANQQKQAPVVTNQAPPPMVTKPVMSLRSLYMSTLLTLLIGLLTFSAVSGCSGSQLPEPGVVETVRMIDVAKQHMATVTEWLAKAKATVDVVEDLANARLAADAEDWKAVLVHLRSAVETAEAAKVEVPEEVREALTAAETALALTGLAKPDH